MTKFLVGRELAEYIKERQAKQVRNLRQAWGTIPKLVIVKSDQASPVIEAYVRMKRKYSADILVETEVHSVSEVDMSALIERLNKDTSVHGMIVQLPLSKPEHTDEITALVAPEKDVDGLGPRAVFDSATATAISWLVVGYGIELSNKKIALVGNGRLVGAPLAKMWRASGYDVTVIDRATEDIAAVLRQSDVIVTAAGVPHLITSAMIKPGAVVVDAATTSEGGLIVGDVDESVRERDDVTITPEKGGVGPLTITSLFENVITAARTAAAQALPSLEPPLDAASDRP